MALKVPGQQVGYVKQLAGMPDTELDELLTAFASARSHFNTIDLVAELQAETALPIGFVNGVVDMLASLYRTRQPSSR